MQLAGANSALALAMTVISNLLGILIVSFKVAIAILWLHLYIYLESHFSINAFASVCLAASDLICWWFCNHVLMSYDAFLFQVPFSISKFIAYGVGVSVPTKQLLKSLVLTLLIPLILGKVKDSFCCSLVFTYPIGVPITKYKKEKNQETQRVSILFLI